MFSNIQKKMIRRFILLTISIHEKLWLFIWKSPTCWLLLLLFGIKCVSFERNFYCSHIWPSRRYKRHEREIKNEKQAKNWINVHFISFVQHNQMYNRTKLSKNQFRFRHSSCKWHSLVLDAVVLNYIRYCDLVRWHL